MTGDPTVVGLTDVLDDRLIYGVSAPTLPGMQDEVRRVWRSLALGAFREGELRQPGGASTVVHGASPGSSPGDPDAR